VRYPGERPLDRVHDDGPERARGSRFADRPSRWADEVIVIRIREAGAAPGEPRGARFKHSKDMEARGKGRVGRPPLEDGDIVNVPAAKAVFHSFRARSRGGGGGGRPG